MKYISVQIRQRNALFSGEIYTAGKKFAQPPVAMVVTNFKSELHLRRPGEQQGRAKKTDNFHLQPGLWAGTRAVQKNSFAHLPRPTMILGPSQKPVIVL